MPEKYYFIQAVSKEDGKVVRTGAFKTWEDAYEFGEKNYDFFEIFEYPEGSFKED